MQNGNFNQIFTSSADLVADAVTANSAYVTVRRDATERTVSTNARASHTDLAVSADVSAIGIAVADATSQLASAFVTPVSQVQSVWTVVQQVGQSTILTITETF